MKLSTYFDSYEFKCHCGKCSLISPPKKLLDILDDVRSHFGRPTTIMSGHRCKKHNDNVGGAPSSQHLLGTAADIIVSGVAPSIVQAYLLKKYPDLYGIGKYHYFTHIDVRGWKARW